MKKYIYITLLCIMAFFVNNEVLLPDIMEARNIVTAREMVSDDSWLVPTMNGELRLEKPPLPTWVAGAIEAVFPDNLGAQRAAAGVMGIIWVVFFYLMAWQITRRNDYAGIATIVFLTCYQVVLMGRTATWDIYCHALMMGAIYFLWRGMYDKSSGGNTHKWKWFPLAGLMMGLSFLSKGPVSFYALLLPFLIAAIIYKRPSMNGKWDAVVVMFLICLLIGSWWYLYLLITHPEAVKAVIDKETGSWVNRNVRPWWYYWRFFTEMGVWTLLMLSALFVPYWKKHLAMKREYLFTIIWVLTSLVLLSLMPEKKMRYLLPMMVPCALSVAFLIQHLCEAKDKAGRILFYVNGGIISLIVIALPVVLYASGYRHGVLSSSQTLFAAILLLCIGMWLTYSTLKFHVVHFLYGMIAIFAVAECFLIGAIGNVLGNTESRSIAETRNRKELADISFYHSKDEELRIELVYAAHRKILPLELKDTSAVMKALPCAVVTRHFIQDELPASVFQKIDTLDIGIYDDNRHPKTDRHYSLLFLNHLTLLKPKKK